MPSMYKEEWRVHRHINVLPVLRGTTMEVKSNFIREVQ